MNWGQSLHPVWSIETIQLCPIIFQHEIVCSLNRRRRVWIDVLFIQYERFIIPNHANELALMIMVTTFYLAISMHLEISYALIVTKYMSSKTVNYNNIILQSYWKLDMQTSSLFRMEKYHNRYIRQTARKKVSILVQFYRYLCFSKWVVGNSLPCHIFEHVIKS